MACLVCLMLIFKKSFNYFIETFSKCWDSLAYYEYWKNYNLTNLITIKKKILWKYCKSNYKANANY